MSMEDLVIWGILITCMVIMFILQKKYTYQWHGRDASTFEIFLTAILLGGMTGGPIIAFLLVFGLL